MIFKPEKARASAARIGARASAGFAALRENPRARRALTIAQAILLVLIVAYLVYRLSLIGWDDLAANLPEAPLFYVFFLLRYLTLPATETIAYQIVWDRPLFRHFPAFLRKRVYNFGVAGYSGEAFLTLWARRRLGLSSRDALVGVKDNNLISGFSANVTTAFMVALLAAGGALGAATRAIPGGVFLFGGAFALASTIALLVAIFRRRLIAIPPRKRRAVLGVHAVRQTCQVLLYAAMYAAALPGPAFFTWLVFIALQLVLSRIPFLPNQDLVYLTAALALAPGVGAPEEAVAGMLLAEAGLSQILNFVLFLGTAYLARRGGCEEPSPLRPDAHADPALCAEKKP